MVVRLFFVEQPLLPNQKSYNKSLFLGPRCSKNRSILDVCEDFKSERNAKIALLGGFYNNFFTSENIL